MEKQKSCMERIEEYLENRLEDIKVALKNDEKREEYESYILSVNKSIIYKVCLSWGGPADYFFIELKKDKEAIYIASIRYQFQDWFDSAERYLEGEEFDLVADMFSYLTEI